MRKRIVAAAFAVALGASAGCLALETTWSIGEWATRGGMVEFSVTEEYFERRAALYALTPNGVDSVYVSVQAADLDRLRSLVDAAQEQLTRHVPRGSEVKLGAWKSRLGARVAFSVSDIEGRPSAIVFVSDAHIVNTVYLIADAAGLARLGTLIDKTRTELNRPTRETVHDLGKWSDATGDELRLGYVERDGERSLFIDVWERSVVNDELRQRTKAWIKDRELRQLQSVVAGALSKLSAGVTKSEFAGELETLREDKFQFFVGPELDYFYVSINVYDRAAGVVSLRTDAAGLNELAELLSAMTPKPTN